MWLWVNNIENDMEFDVVNVCAFKKKYLKQ